MKSIKVDIPFLVSVGILVVVGFLIFSSASLGLLAQQSGIYSSVSTNQLFFGLLGLIACFITSKTDYKIYKKYSIFLFVASIIATLLVFVPHIGVSIGGARRWVYIGSLSFQPSELLKIGYIIYLATWMSNVKNKAQTFKYGFLPFVVLSAIVAVILLKQPDTDTFLITVFSGVGIFLAAGGRWKHVFVTALAGILLIAALAFIQPYVMSRIKTFINPADNALGSGYQIQQSLIAIGSGGITGRGYGQSIQKFNFLPQPTEDSIFAVAGEEFGFIGTTIIILLFVFLAVRGLKIATSVPDSFGRLMVVGIVILVVSQAFVNIGAMVGVLPLSGITLPFVSHGGTALFMTLAEMGIVLNISKTMRKT